MNIEIPGFEETPEKIENNRQADYICKMADIKLICTDTIYVRNAKKIKKLLDDRRELLIHLIKIIDGYDRKVFRGEIYCYIHNPPPGGEPIYECACNIKKAFDLIEKITGKTWEELQEWNKLKTYTAK